MKDLFEREQRVYDGAVGHSGDDIAPGRDAYAALAGEYGRLLKQLRRVTKLSDKTVVELNASKIDLLDNLLKMSSLAESSPNFVAYKKFTGECLYLNPAASALTGYSREELMEDYIGVLFDAETAERFRTEIPAALLKRDSLTYEVSAKCKDGSVRIFSVCSFLIESDEEAFGTIATDITEKKRIEQERQEALEKAEYASRAKSDFLSRMNHELKTPMNAIIGMTSLARRAEEINEARKYLDEIDDAAGQLLGIIEDVLDMSRIYAGETELSEDAFSVNELLDEICAAEKAKFDDKRQVFIFESDADIPEILITDRQKLERVITCLLDNACKFTPERGTVGMTVRVDSIYDNRCRLRFAIEDNGIGITEEQKARIWDAFEQSDNTITRRYGGTGLGLAITHKFISMLGGEITVESAPGLGAKFTFTVDAGIGGSAADESAVNEGETETCENIFAGRHILLVDDVEINREVLIALLSETGAHFSCVENGAEACEVFSADPEAFDLILMDIHMPEMNGYEASETIRGMTVSRAREIPIIAVTADVDSEKIAASGMNGSVGKPLDMDVLIAELKQYIDK